MISFITGLIVGVLGALVGFHVGWANGWRKAARHAARLERGFNQRKSNEGAWPGPTQAQGRDW